MQFTHHTDPVSFRAYHEPVSMFGIRKSRFSARETKDTVWTATAGMALTSLPVIGWFCWQQLGHDNVNLMSLPSLTTTHQVAVSGIAYLAAARWVYSQVPQRLKPRFFGADEDKDADDYPRARHTLREHRRRSLGRRHGFRPSKETTGNWVNEQGELVDIPRVLLGLTYSSIDAITQDRDRMRERQRVAREGVTSLYNVTYSALSSAISQVYSNALRKIDSVVDDPTYDPDSWG